MSTKNLIKDNKKYLNFSSQIFDEYKALGKARIISGDAYDRFMSEVDKGVYEDFEKMKEEKRLSLRKEVY